VSRAKVGQLAAIGAEEAAELVAWAKASPSDHSSPFRRTFGDGAWHQRPDCLVQKPGDRAANKSVVSGVAGSA
jgi:hypothetical protein